MLHPSILSADILDSIERGERAHQLPRDFGLDAATKVKDEIADAWAAARAYWAAYQVKIPHIHSDPPEAKAAWTFDGHDVLLPEWEGKTTKDSQLIDACNPDEWLLVQAWDES